MMQRCALSNFKQWELQPTWLTVKVMLRGKIRNDDF